MNMHSPPEPDAQRKAGPRAATATDAHIGAKLRDARQFRQMSQEALGTRLGLTFQQIQKYENGANRITAATLYRASQVLGLAPLWFFEGLETVAEGEKPPLLDAQQYRLLAQFDRIAYPDIRAGIVSFIANIADGIDAEKARSNSKAVAP